MRAFRVFDRSYTVTQSRWLSHLLTFGVILVATGLVAGCMKVNTLVRVEPDGTGVIEERTVLSKRLVLMMREMGKELSGGEKPADDFSIVDDEQLQAKAANFGEGVEFVSSEQLNTEFGEGYLAVYRFDDVSRIQIEHKPEDPGNAPPAGSDGPENPPVRFKFEPASGNDPAVLTINATHSFEDSVSADSGSSSEASTPPASEAMPEEMMRKIFEGMQIGISLEVEGDVVDSNATHMEGNRVVLLELDFDKVLTDPTKLAVLATSQGPSDFNSLKKLMSAIPGLRAELKEEVQIRFEPR